MILVHDVIVVGGGQAGLAASYWLSQASIPHLILERGAIGQSWRSQRWDSFRLNTPNWFNALAGMMFHPEAPDAFPSAQELVAYFEEYARAFELPLRPRTEVKHLRRMSSGQYALRTQTEELRANSVILASGGMTRPRLPSMARRLPENLMVLSAGTYRNPAALPPGTVLVVGSGQSGCQIAEDLLEAGRRVILSVSKVARVPRFYRGRDILAWWRDTGVVDVKLQQLPDPSQEFAAQPQVSGVRGGHTVSLQSLAHGGAVLVGRVLDVDRHTVHVDHNVAECLRFADEKSRAFKAEIDAYIQREGIRVQPASADPGEPSHPDLRGSDLVTSLDLQQEGVSSIVWCIGFDADWRWVEVDVFDSTGRPRHRDGITQSPGLYFLGLPWLSARKSGVLFGVSEDAERIVQHLRAHGSAH